MRMRFSEKLKKLIHEQEKIYPIENPIVAILFTSSNGSEENLTLGFYDKDNLPSADEFHIFKSDGVEFLFPQKQFHDALDGRLLDITNGKIVVKD